MGTHFPVQSSRAAVADVRCRAGFLLVCGCPRSGTTLLAEQLSQRLDVALPIETHFVPSFARASSLWGGRGRFDSARVRSALAAYTRILHFRGTRFRSPERLLPYSILPAIESTESTGEDLSSLLHAIFRQYATAAGRVYYGDKSAPYDPEDLSWYSAGVEGLKIVHLVRDGRDVCLSWRSQWFGPSSVAEAAWNWRRHVLRRRRWGRANPGRYLEVRYEDFVHDPDAITTMISAFAEIPRLSAESRHSILADAIGDEPTHTKLKSPPDAGGVGRWRTAMPKSDQALFDWIAGDTLEACGYSREMFPTPAITVAKMGLRSAVGMLRRYLTTTYYLRRARGLMPLALGISQHLGVFLPLVRLVDPTARSGSSR